MDRLSLLDAQFVEAEDADPRISMAIASIAVFEGPAPAYEELVAEIERHLPLVPRYRQKLRTVPLRIGPPVWVDDPKFDVRRHIRRIALPKPGGDAELGELMAWVMAERLDRDHPLWEYWFVTGLAGRHWALISKVHHSMVDGVSGTDLYRVMFDTALDESAPTEQPPAHEPTVFELIARATGQALLLPARRARSIGTMLTRPAPTLRQGRETVRGMWTMAGGVTPAPASSLSGPIGRRRRYTFVRAPLDDVRTVKATLGGTVNDTVLAAISAGFRALLISRGETPRAGTVPSLVPVSLRAPGEEGIYDNRVSAMIVHLPVHLSEPTEQLSAIRKEVAALKGADESAAAAGRGIARFLHLLPPGLLDAPGLAASAALHRDGHHQRARTPSDPALPRAAPCRDPSLRTDRLDGPDRHRHLQLSRPDHLRDHWRLRHYSGPGRAGAGHRRRGRHTAQRGPGVNRDALTRFPFGSNPR